MSDLRTPEVDALLEVLCGITDVDDAFALLEDLFTIREIRETSQRLAVARMLADGRPYVAIEEATGASATTIARVSKALNYGAGGYRTALAILESADEKGGEAGEGEAGEEAGTDGAGGAGAGEAVERRGR